MMMTNTANIADYQERKQGHQRTQGRATFRTEN